MSPADYYSIELIEVPRESIPIAGLVKVTAASELFLRQEVERFARYFLREMHTGGIQYEASENEFDGCFVPYEAYIFEHQSFCVGACCFRQRPSSQDCASLYWSMDWIWLHPYVRRNGILTRAWQEFERTYGENFDLAKPLSSAMESFVAKRRHTSNA